MPTNEEILKVVNQTDQTMASTVARNQEMLKRSIRKLEKQIMAAYTGLTVGGDGNLVGPRVNLKQSQKIHKKLVTLFEEEYGAGARRAVKGYGAVDKAIQREFKEFDIAAEFTDVDATMIKTLKNQAYEEYVRFGTAAQDKIAQAMYDTVAARGSFSELLETTTGILLGGVDGRGRSMAAYATQWANDGVMNYHQAVTLQKAQDASLVTFLYYGDIIKTSRQFCIDRVGKVFTKKQIESWDGMYWAGKSGPALTYRGGYNCRHHWHPIKKDWIPEGEIPIQDIYREQGIDIPRGLTIPVWPTSKRVSKKVVKTGAKAAVYKDPYDRWVPTSMGQAGAADWNRSLLKYGEEFAELEGLGPCGPVAENIVQVLQGMGRDARIMMTAFDDGVNAFPHYVAVEVNKAEEVIRLWDPTNPFIKQSERILKVNPKRLPRKWFPDGYHKEVGLEWELLPVDSDIVRESGLYDPGQVNWFKSKMLKPDGAKAPLKGMPKVGPEKRVFKPTKNIKTAKQQTMALVEEGMGDDWPVRNVEGRDILDMRFNHTGTKAAWTQKGKHWATLEDRGNLVYGPQNVKYVERGPNRVKQEVWNVVNESLGVQQDRAIAYGIPRIRGMYYGASGSSGASMGDGVLFINNRVANSHFRAVGAKVPENVAKQLDKVVKRLKADIKASADPEEIKALKGYLKIKQAELKAAKAGRVRHLDSVKWDMPKKVTTTGPPVDTSGRPYSSKRYFEYADERLRTTMEHEFGHHVHQTLFVDGNGHLYKNPPLEAWLDKFKNYNKNQGTPLLSPTGYGETDMGEFFAENYALWQQGKQTVTTPQLRPLLRALDELEAGKLDADGVLDIMDEMLGEEVL